MDILSFTVLGFTIVEIIFICLALTVLAFIIAVILRIWIKYTMKTFVASANLKGKTIVITGANSGIGKETARVVAKQGARVIMACRNMKTAKLCRDEIAAESENHEIIVQKLDLSSLQSVREFSEAIIQTEDKIDVLIHNAGCGTIFTKMISNDGIENTMATNFYGPFLLTCLLMDLLKKSAPCRIVYVSSNTHSLSLFNPTKEKYLNPIDKFPLMLYANSKLAFHLAAFELARRLQGTGVTINVLHPGLIDTEIWRFCPFPLSILWRIVRVFMRNAEEGAQSTLFAALSTNLDNVTGQYISDCQIVQPSKKSLNVEWQRIMFKEAVKIVELRNTDPNI